MIEGFTCQLKVKPITDWVEEENGKSCHPCLIKPLVSYYLGTIEKSNDPKAKEATANVKKAWESSDILTIAKELDKVKKEVGDNLRKELITLDCFTQSYEE